MSDLKVAHIFIDEYGTPDLQVGKEGNVPFFVYAAVVIPSSELDNAYKIHKGIVNSDFPAGYIKSSRIKNSKEGFAQYLSALIKFRSLKHYVIALIVDKSEIKKTSGLTYKSVFIKYFQRLLSISFYETYDEFHIVADKTGSNDFIESLKSYMRERGGIEPTLFSNNTFSVADDISDEPLLQIADLYAGVLGRYFCGKFEKNHAQVIHDIVKTKVSLEWFPKENTPMVAMIDGLDEDFDNELFNLSIDTAQKYLDDYPDDKVGCELLLYIIQEARQNPRRHISSKEIKEFLMSKGIEIGDPIEKVSELRDRGVIIISPIGKKGYKFPINEKEIAEFLNRLSSNVIPQIKRGYIINDTLARKSYGTYDVLKTSEFEVLYKLSEIVNHG